MRHANQRLFVLLASGLALVATAGLDAQSLGAGPGVTLDYKEVTGLDAASFATANLFQTSGSRYLAQVQMTKGIGNTPGVFHCALTVYSLADQYSGANPGVPSGQYVLLGKWDQNTQTFTPSNDATKLNDPSGGNFGLMLEPKLGREAVLDRSDGVYFAQRVPTQPFPAATRVTNWPTGKTYVDPALGYIDNVLHMFWVDSVTGGIGIVAQPLQVQNGQATLVGQAIEVARPRAGAVNIHSPSPILGPDGNVHGLTISHQGVANDSDFAFQPYLDPSLGYFIVHDNAQWMNNGSVCGGTFFFANTGSTGGFYNAINSSEVSWHCASESKVGGPAVIFGAGRNLTLPLPLTDVFFIAGQVVTPLKVPGFYGEFGLDLATFQFLTAPTSSDADEIAGVQFTIPNDPGFKGLYVATSGLTITLGAKGAAAFQNTGYLIIR